MTSSLERARQAERLQRQAAQDGTGAPRIDAGAPDAEAEAERKRRAHEAYLAHLAADETHGQPTPAQARRNEIARRDAEVARDMAADYDTTYPDGRRVRDWTEWP